MQTNHIPFNRPSIGQEEIDEVIEVLQSGWLTTGPKTQQFEKEFREYVGSKHSLAVTSGTAAMQLALVGLGIGPGDEVITTPLTFCATVNTILQAGAAPILADVDNDGNIDPQSIAERITSRTAAVMPVHLGGLPCQMDQIWTLARQNDLRVIEDAAHAVGAHYRGWPIGAGQCSGEIRSDAVAYSFYATKNLTTGEGGMVVTDHGELAESMRILSLHGIQKDAWHRNQEQRQWVYEVLACGFKYNMPDILSAIGRNQLRRQEEFVRTRASYAQMYNQAFADISEIEAPEEHSDRRHAWHLYMIKLNLNHLSIDRSTFIDELQARGIGTSVHFIPIPLHAAFSPYSGLRADLCPKAMAMYPRLVSLPLYPGMSVEEVECVIETVVQIVVENRRRTLVAVNS